MASMPVIRAYCSSLARGRTALAIPWCVLAAVAFAMTAAAEWRVSDAGAGSLLTAAGTDTLVPGLDMRLETTSADGVEACTALDTLGEDRAVILAWCVPLDARGWTWWDDANQSRTIEGAGPYHNLTEGYYGALIHVSRYPLAVMDNGVEAFCLAVPPKPGRAVRFLYDPAQLELRAEFDFGLSKDCGTFRSSADAAVVAYRVPTPWAFRQALATYYTRYADAFVRRAGPGGTLLRGAALDGIARPVDFHFAWHDFSSDWVSVADWSAVDTLHGVESYHYCEPQTHWRYLRGAERSHDHVTFDDGSSGVLAPQGGVAFADGRATLAPGAALALAGFPSASAENLVAEFTIDNLTRVYAGFGGGARVDTTPSKLIGVGGRLGHRRNHRRYRVDLWPIARSHARGGRRVRCHRAGRRRICGRGTRCRGALAGLPQQSERLPCFRTLQSLHDLTG